MNMLPINSEWKRRIKWADKQRKEQMLADTLAKKESIVASRRNSKIVGSEREGH